uniref:Calsequestrin n=1 Tax=Cyprinus carpio TaxID=7962 RepID=A0A8C1M859_CYPCA
MKWGWVLLGVLLTFGYLCWSEKGLEFPEYDGKDRVHQLTIKNYKSVMKRYDAMVIYYHKPVGENGMSRKQFEVEELALELLTSPASLTYKLAAQVLDDLEDEDIGFGLVDSKKERAVAKKLGLLEVDSIYIFADDEIIEYDGELAADTLLEFLYDVIEEPVEIISNDRELKGFHHIEEDIKLMGYFKSAKSSYFTEYDDAAEEFHPFIKFFATFEPKIANKLNLKMNEVDFYEPFMNKPVTIPGEPYLEDDIVSFIEEHDRPTLRKLEPHSMYEIWVSQSQSVVHHESFSANVVVLIHHLHYVKRGMTFDPSVSPQMVPYWEKTFGIDLSSPQIGVVDVEDADSVWMEMDEEEDMPTADELDTWIEGVMSGRINPDDETDYNHDDDEEEDDDDEDE